MLSLRESNTNEMQSVYISCCLAASTDCVHACRHVAMLLIRAEEWMARREGVGATVYPSSCEIPSGLLGQKRKLLSPLHLLSLCYVFLTFFQSLSFVPSISLRVYHAASVAELAEGHCSRSGRGQAVRGKHRVIVTTLLSQLVTLKGALVQSPGSLIYS